MGSGVIESSSVLSLTLFHDVYPFLWSSGGGSWFCLHVKCGARQPHVDWYNAPPVPHFCWLLPMMMSSTRILFLYFPPDFCGVSASLLVFSARIALSELNFEWCLTESYSICPPMEFDSYYPQLTLTVSYLPCSQAYVASVHLPHAVSNTAVHQIRRG